MKDRKRTVKGISRKLEDMACKKCRIPFSSSRPRLQESMRLAGCPRLPSESRAKWLLRFVGEDSLDASEAEMINRRSGRRWQDMKAKKVYTKSSHQKIGKPHPNYVRDDSFYSSREWRELRYLALKNTDGRCQACGGSAKDGICIHVDHVIPRYKRPDLALALDNLQVLCEDCNIGKGAWDQTDWRPRL